MADVLALCPRVILIHGGRIFYDGELNGLARRLAPYKLLKVTLGAAPDGLPALPPGAEAIAQEDQTLTLRVGRDDAPRITATLLNTLPVADLVVEDPPLEAVIDKIYQEGAL